MAESDFRGPLMNMGSLEVQSGNTATIEPMDGPSGSYQGLVFLDPRATPFAKDGMLPGRVPGFLVSADMFGVDQIPMKASTVAVAAASTIATTVAVAMGLATTGVAGTVSGTPGIAVKVPLRAQNTSVIVNPALTLDFGFATGTTVVNSSTVVVNDSTLFRANQWIIIGNAGASNQASFITQVQAVTNATTLQVSPLPSVAATIAPIGAANLFGSELLPPSTQFGPSTSTANAHLPAMSAGLARIWNPKELVARNLSISIVTGGVATAASFLVSGWDVWGQPMTETIAAAAATVGTTTFGLKTWKYINSITVTASGTANSYSIGFGDVFGFPLRADEWEQTSIYWNGNDPTTSLGFTAFTTTANSTAGDVRGTIQVSTNGAGSAITISTAAVSNGTSRLVIIQNPGPYSILNATPLNTNSLFGVTQA